jgi:hypothetical protein
MAAATYTLAPHPPKGFPAPFPCLLSARPPSRDSRGSPSGAGRSRAPPSFRSPPRRVPGEGVEPSRPTRGHLILSQARIASFATPAGLIKPILRSAYPPWGTDGAALERPVLISEHANPEDRAGSLASDSRTSSQRRLRRSRELRTRSQQKCERLLSWPNSGYARVAMRRWRWVVAILVILALASVGAALLWTAVRVDAGRERTRNSPTPAETWVCEIRAPGCSRSFAFWVPRAYSKSNLDSDARVWNLNIDVLREPCVARHASLQY